jgi:cytoskeletal protein CcmA (bactofilin family)
MTPWREAVPKDPVSKASERPDGASASLDVSDRSEPRAGSKESVIAANLTIEGRIEGAGHVRIAGSFKGDVQVEGNLTIEAGARLNGEVRADSVIVGGELHGNIHAASRVELLESGVVIGDLKALTLTVAAGSRMRGNAEFGWEDKRAGTLDSSTRDGASP